MTTRLIAPQRRSTHHSHPAWILGDCICGTAYAICHLRAVDPDLSAADLIQHETIDTDAEIRICPQFETILERIPARRVLWVSPQRYQAERHAGHPAEVRAINMPIGTRVVAVDDDARFLVLVPLPHRVS